MKPRAIIFDFFGVICSEVTPFWFQKYFHGNEAEKLRDSYMESVDLGEVSEEKLLQRLGKLVYKEPKEIENELQSLAKLNGNVIDFIKKIKPFYKIGLCSDSSSDFIRPILEQNKLTELFDTIVISSECGFVKPDPKIYRLILEKLSVKANETIFIDDSPENIAGAEKTGMQVILFSNFEELLKMKFLDNH